MRLTMVDTPRHRAAVIALTILLAAALGAAPAHAHTASTFYYPPNKWPSGSDVPFRFQVLYPAGAHRTAAEAAVAQWNSRGGSAEPDLYRNLSDGFGTYNDPCGNSASILVWMDLDSIEGTGALGATRSCTIGGSFGVRSKFVIAIDSDRSWYTGTGTVPSNQFDVRTVLAHEFGHATGWKGHFQDTSADNCGWHSGRNTMCRDIPIGTNWQASLEPHDVHTFEGAY